MIIGINYKHGNLAGAKLYMPDEPSDVLLVWAGGGCLFRYDLESLGKHIAKGEIKPKCNVLMPWCKSRKCMEDISVYDIAECVSRALYYMRDAIRYNYAKIRFCGYSKGSDAVQKWLDTGLRWCDRFSLISNFPHGWYKSGKVPPDVPARFYFGGAEKSHVQPWGKLCDMFADADYTPVGRLDHGQMARKFWLSPEGRGLMDWMEE